MDLAKMLPHLYATHQDPSHKVRCGNQISHEVRTHNRRPSGEFDLCFELLDDRYRWIIPLAEKYCDQGLLSIYYRKDRRFTHLATFKMAFEADPETPDVVPPLPVEFRFGHTLAFLIDEDEMLRNSNAADQG